MTAETLTQALTNTYIALPPSLPPPQVTSSGDVVGGSLEINK
jgi:hypothetical protein